MSISGVFEVSNDVNLIMNKTIAICKYRISYDKDGFSSMLFPSNNVLVSISSYEAIIGYLKHFSDYVKTSVFRYSKQIP